MFANVVGASVKSTVFVKFATARSLSAKQYGNGKKMKLTEDDEECPHIVSDE